LKKFIPYLLIPISLVLAWMRIPGWIIFFVSALAIAPLSATIGMATEELSKRVGALLGGWLNAAFGNATELIIIIIAIRAGEMDVVRASLIGSIMGNILLVLGLSMFLGGLRYKIQTFNEDAAGIHTVMLILAMTAIIIPSLFAFESYHSFNMMLMAPRLMGMSEWISGILLLLYIGSLIFSMKTHQKLFETDDDDRVAPPLWSTRKATTILLLSTILVAVLSDILVRSIQPMVTALGLSKIFIGIIVIPIIGNATEHAVAINMAMRDKMDISLNICISSSTQMAFLIAPVAVFVSIPLGHPFPFVFDGFELIAVGFSALIAAFIARDGKCNWLEGAQLIVVYAILAVAFYFLPQ
jgi:Ca2+:H+ antiporter